jgi:hypothetical protein
LWRPSLPAWRRAATRATLAVRIAGAADDPDGLSAGTAPPEAPTVIVVDDAHALMAMGSGEATSALWSSHPLVVTLARAAIEATP